jgi:hypothetical protein
MNSKELSISSEIKFRTIKFQKLCDRIGTIWHEEACKQSSAKIKAIMANALLIPIHAKTLKYPGLLWNSS